MNQFFFSLSLYKKKIESFVSTSYVFYLVSKAKKKKKDLIKWLKGLKPFLYNLTQINVNLVPKISN